MKTNFKILYSLIIISLIAGLSSCKKDSATSRYLTDSKTERITLNNEQKQMQLRLKQIALVFGEVIKNKAIRSEFNEAIALKLKDTKNDESISLHEIYGIESKNSVKTLSDAFAAKLVNSMQQVLNSGKYLNSNEFLEINEKAKRNRDRFMSIDGKPEALTVVDPNGGGGYEPEIYFPYSENFTTSWGQGYTITSDPIDNDDENVGVRWDAITETWEEVLVDDNYAYNNPTYIVIVEDSYNNINELAADFQVDLPKQVILNDNYYELNLNNSGYNFTGTSNTPPNPSNAQNSTLFVRDVRVTEVPGLFEGKTEFAFVVPAAKEISLENGNPTINSAKILTFAMVQIKRKRVKDMKANVNISESVGWTIRNWASADGELSFIIYELDRAFLGSPTGAQTSVNFMTDASGIFSDPKDPSIFSRLIAGPIAKAATALIPGASADVKHSYMLNRDEVFNNQTQPNIAMSPSLLNGYRPYGSNTWMVNYVFQ